MAQPTIKVIGKIKIPEPKKKVICSCDKCGRRVDNSFGDPRIIIYSLNKSVIKQVCEECVNEN